MTKNNKLNSKDLANVFNSLIQAKKEYEIVKEQETTKRMQIESDLNKFVLKISTQRSIIEDLLRNEYSMRKDVIEKLFGYVERALNENNNDIVIKAIDSIEGIIKVSPISELAKIRRELDDENSVLDI